MFKKLLIGFCSVIVIVLIGNILIAQDVFGARSQYGLTGIYNSSALNLSDGEGAALALDAYGRLVISTTTQISVAFSSSLPTTIKFTSSTASSILGTLWIGGSSTTTITGNTIVSGYVKNTFDLGKFYVASTGALTSSSTITGTTLYGTAGELTSSLIIAKTAGTFDLGKFYVNSSGNIMSSGTLGIAGLSSLTTLGVSGISNFTGAVGMTTATPKSALQVTGSVGATTTIWAGGLNGEIGEICFGDSDGTGAHCYFDANGTMTSYEKTAY